MAPMSAWGQLIPDDFDWADLSYPVTPDSGRSPVDLPSVLQPWDPAPIRGLHGFARKAIAERARLALADPENEADAIRPMSSVRARWILWTLAEQDREAEGKYRTRAVFPKRVADLGSGRDLLTRLGADPERSSGVVVCPAHEDGRPSLSWRLANDGRALLHCFAGCDFRAILAAAT